MTFNVTHFKTSDLLVAGSFNGVLTLGDNQ
jgi:hypothetical protein